MGKHPERKQAGENSTLLLARVKDAYPAETGRRGVTAAQMKPVKPRAKLPKRLLRTWLEGLTLPQLQLPWETLEDKDGGQQKT